MPPVVARGPCEIAFCCPSPPPPPSTAGLSGFFVWEPTVTQSALHTFIHSFLSWGWAALGTKQAAGGLSLQEFLGNVERVIPGRQKVALFQVSSYRLCFLTMGLKQQEKRQNWELGQAGKEGKSTSSILSGSPFLWSLHFPFCSLGPHFTLEVSSAFMALPMAFWG